MGSYEGYFLFVVITLTQIYQKVWPSSWAMTYLPSHWHLTSHWRSLTWKLQLKPSGGGSGAHCSRKLGDVPSSKSLQHPRRRSALWSVSGCSCRHRMSIPLHCGSDRQSSKQKLPQGRRMWVTMAAYILPVCLWMQPTFVDTKSTHNILLLYFSQK